jgi:hypothetical protein
VHFLQRGGETFRSKRPHGFVPAGWTESAVVGGQIECRHGGEVDAGAQGKCSGREGFLASAPQEHGLGARGPVKQRPRTLEQGLV